MEHSDRCAYNVKKSLIGDISIFSKFHFMFLF